MLRDLYDWVLHWAETPYGSWALGALAFTESSFFPIPPDALLIALALSVPAKAFWYAFICSGSSVVGGMLGYLIGLFLMQVVGNRILSLYGATDKFQWVKSYYERYDAWAVGVAGFTPIPYKIFTIAAGACRINFKVFLLASAISRSARFFLVAALIYQFGEPIKIFIDRYFNLLSIIFVALLILGFVVIRLFLRASRSDRGEPA